MLQQSNPNGLCSPAVQHVTFVPGVVLKLGNLLMYCVASNDAGCHYHNQWKHEPPSSTFQPKMRSKCENGCFVCDIVAPTKSKYQCAYHVMSQHTAAWGMPIPFCSRTVLETKSVRIQMVPSVLSDVDILLQLLTLHAYTCSCAQLNIAL